MLKRMWCKWWGHLPDRDAQQHGYDLCQRCGFDGGYGYADFDEVGTLGWWWWNNVTMRFKGYYVTIYKRIKRCQQCGDTLNRCACLPF